MAGLKPATKRTYLGVLRDFESFTAIHRGRLLTRQDVDFAAYNYILAHTKSRGENLIAALYKCFPPLRGHLTWAAARLRVLAASSPPAHHLPMDWLIAVGIAYFTSRRHLPRQAGLLLLQWKFGLRPSEALNLTGSDLVCRPSPHGHHLAYIKVGSLRGTKAGRPQIARARLLDRHAVFLLDLFAKNTPADVRLSTLNSLPQLQTLISRGLRDANINLHFTPHCPRAGWATHRYLSGRPFVSLREDGRWRSDSSLRVYLDVVANTNLLDAPDVHRQLSFLQYLSDTLETWLTF